MNPPCPVVFDEAAHTYTLGGKLLASVGSVCRRYKNGFDADYWAGKKAAERGVAKEVVLAEWAERRDASCANGHDVHEFARAVLEGRKVVLTGEMAQAREWLHWWERKASASLTPVGVEVILYDAALGIAGTADLVARSSKTGKLHVLDWKTNAKFTTDSRYRKRLKQPFGFLPECHLSEYSLQLELYRMLGRAQFGEEFGSSYVVHLGEVAAPYRCHKLWDVWERELKKGKT